MKLSILYHPDSESARSVEEFSHNFQKQTGQEVEFVSLDTSSGWELARLYDIVSYPAVLVRRDSGELLNSWQGESLPLINEVAGYVWS